MKRRFCFPYSAEELAFIERNKNLPRAELHFEFVTTFDRFDVTKHAIQQLCNYRGWHMDELGWATSYQKRTEGARRETTWARGYVGVYDPRGKKYIRKHRIVWEQKHGPIPDGMVLMCRSKDRANCDPSNWAMVDRRMTNPMAIRGFDVASPDLQETILAVAKIELSLRRRTGKRQARRATLRSYVDARRDAAALLQKVGK